VDRRVAGVAVGAGAAVVSVGEAMGQRCRSGGARRWASVWALALCGVLAAAGAARAEPPRRVAAPAAEPQPEVYEATIVSRHVGKQVVVFVAPPGYGAGSARLPAVVTWAGRGESVRGNRAGAWGWVERYGVVEAMAALHRNHLTREDFQGLVGDGALEATNAALREQPYRGVLLVCPYPPHRASERARYEAFVLEELIPYTKAHFRVFEAPERWGVDGISLGGTLAYSLGFGHPEAFGAVGGQQAAVGAAPPAVLAAVEANRVGARGLRVNVATSARDPFRASLTTFVGHLRRLGVDARFVVLEGAHDKRFVRGPGSIELLLFQDRALWGSGAMPPVSADGAAVPAPAAD